MNKSNRFKKILRLLPLEIANVDHLSPPHPVLYIFLYHTNNYFILIFWKAVRDIGNIIAASDRTNKTLQLCL